MSKKLSFFESIYLNKKSKELHNTQPNILNEDAQNIVNDDLTLGVFLESKNNTDSDESFISLKKPDSIKPLNPDSKISLSKNDSEDTQSVAKKSNKSFETATNVSENTNIDNDLKDDFITDTKVVKEIAFKQNLIDENISGEKTSEENISQEAISQEATDSDPLPSQQNPNKKKKKRKNKNKNKNLDNVIDDIKFLNTEIIETETIETESIDIKTIDSKTIENGTLDAITNDTNNNTNSNPEFKNLNKNIQTNIDGISELLSKVTDNSSAMIDTELKDDDDLFLHIEIPTDDLDALEFENFDDVSDFADVNFNKNFNENISNAFVEDLEVDNSGIIHFDLDDQLSDIDLQGSIDEDLVSTKQLSKVMNTVDEESETLQKVSDYKPIYKNSFEDEVLDTTEESSTLNNQNSSFALLDTLEDDEDFEQPKNNNEETKINIPML